jgi:hypothetical protein
MIRRSLLLGAALAALLSACGDDDDGAARADVCARVDVDALADAVDLELDEPSADDTTCQVSSSESAAILGFSFTDLHGVTAPTALGAVRQGCDADTAIDLTPSTGEAAFGCRVQGAVTVAAADADHLAVLSALTLEEGVADADRFEALLPIVDGSLAVPEED